jgi:hypothetical protein
MNDTPETDHVENNLGNCAHPVLSSFCRKLERERDRLAEAIQKHRDELELTSGESFDRILWNTLAAVEGGSDE